MPTLIRTQDWETGDFTGTISNGSNASVTTGAKHSGTYGLQLSGASSAFVEDFDPEPNAVLVGQFYWRYTTMPTGGQVYVIALHSFFDGQYGRIGYDQTNNKLFAELTSGSGQQLASSTVTVNTWYKIDFKFDISGTTHTLDWKIDGVAQTQASKTGRHASYVDDVLPDANTISGTPGSPVSNYDDMLYSATAADYPIALGQTVTVGQATESDSTLAIGWSKAVTVGLPSETDSTLSATPLRTETVGQATESDAALSASHAKGATTNLASEVDSALSVAPERSYGLTEALETDSPLAVSILRTVHLGLATESDSALRLSGHTFVTVGLATETDSAFAVKVSKVLHVGLATETDFALAAIIGIAVPLKFHWERDYALPLVRIDESDDALPLVRNHQQERTTVLGRTQEHDQALALVR